MNSIPDLLASALRESIPAEGWRWLEKARAELGNGAGLERFCGLVSLSSRYIPRRGGPVWSAAQRAQAGRLLAGWDPERWTSLECGRALLVLALKELEAPRGASMVEEAFRYADMGELCALYKTLALLPEPKRFVWRAGEGCRSSMKSVFEAVACDNPLPVRHFDDVAWRQMLIKALFVEAPLSRVFGLETRLDAEIARMALDLADERRSAGRPVNPDSWRLVAKHGGARGIASLERESASGTPAGKAAASEVLARSR
ncbi:MAG: EboA domain-containing protein [Planctomycetes bacterium]|nr:EboA domain-containing protein [Planctomycetota bacterium]